MCIIFYSGKNLHRDMNGLGRLFEKKFFTIHEYYGWVSPISVFHLNLFQLILTYIISPNL